VQLNDKKIAIIGLRYVGLPLAVEFAKLRPVAGFEINLVVLGRQYFATMFHPQVACH
jgi:UDP-N-acetyl-D-mannosaminuronate dehydrogenase